MTLFLSAAFLLFAQSSGAPPSAARNAQALSNPGTWIGEEDYPADALREGVEGRVGVAYKIASDGRVTECRVIDSSGNASLDAATCRLIGERARYEPAHDDRGQPVASEATLRISWGIPDKSAGDHDPRWERGNWHWSARLRFAEDGSIASCSSTGSHPYGGGDPCTVFRQSPPPYVPFSRPQGFRVDLAMEGVQRFDGNPIRLTPPAGGTAIMDGAARFTVQPDGQVSSCTVVDPDAMSGRDSPCYVAMLRFQPSGDASGPAEASSALGVWVLSPDGDAPIVTVPVSPDR